MFRSSNPVFTNNNLFQRQTWDDFERQQGGAQAATVSTQDAVRAAARERTNVMTVQGTAVKTMILLGITIAFAAIGWGVSSGSASALPLTLGAGLLAFGLSLLISFKPKTAPWAAPVFGALEGLFLGAVSMVYFNLMKDSVAGGMLIAQAVMITFSIFGVMLMGYMTGVLRATPLVKKVVTVGFAGIIVVVMASFLLSMFGSGIPALWDGGPIAIGFAIFVIAIATLGLLVDFDFIEQGANQQLPKYMEWVGGFGLLVSLVWIYLYVLRLLYYLRGE